jgi:hypothetical protein
MDYYKKRSRSKSLSPSADFRKSSSLSFSSSLQLTNDIILDIANKYISFNEDEIKYEVCGNFQLNERNEIISYTINEIDMEQNKINVKTNPNMRLNCSHQSPYTSHIFHTHPNKIYPSDIDIYKILKHDLIKHSYIISNEGYFKMSYPSKINIDEITSIDKKKLTRILDKYYFDTNIYKGRIYIKNYMKDLITSLKAHVNNIIVNSSGKNVFKIKFVPFKKIN